MDQTVPLCMPEPIKATTTPIHSPSPDAKYEEKVEMMEVDPKWPEVEELETDLFIAFKDLLEQEQDTIINRLKQLVYNLRKLKHQKTLSPGRTELDYNSPVTSQEPHKPSLGNNNPLELRVIVEKKTTNTNLVISSQNPIFNIITAD